jgi:hypothetical protein
MKHPKPFTVRVEEGGSVTVPDVVVELKAAAETLRDEVENIHETHTPWNYTEYGVLCACGDPMSNEVCPTARAMRPERLDALATLIDGMLDLHVPDSAPTGGGDYDCICRAGCLLDEDEACPTLIALATYTRTVLHPCRDTPVEGSLMGVPGQGDGVTLNLSLADQLALGRALHRYLADRHPGVVTFESADTNDQGYLGIQGWVQLTRDDEVLAVQHALGIGQETVQSNGQPDQGV